MWTAESRAFVGDFGAGRALSDDQYHLLEPLIPPPKLGGRPRTTDPRQLLDGLFYLVCTGCQWRHLPPPPIFPPWPTVYGYFRAFLAAGVWESMRRQLADRRSGRVECGRSYAAAATTVISAQSSKALVRAARYSVAVTCSRQRGKRLLI